MAGKRLILTPEELRLLAFPLKGVDVVHPFSEQPEGTTRTGQNVRVHDSFADERARGGSRSGLKRYIDERVNGVAAIQHLNSIVTVSGEALGWEFGGSVFPDAGPIGKSEAADGPSLGGGGGYQPSESFQETRLLMKGYWVIFMELETLSVPSTDSIATFRLSGFDEFNASDFITYTLRYPPLVSVGKTKKGKQFSNSGLSSLEFPPNVAVQEYYRNAAGVIVQHPDLAYERSTINQVMRNPGVKTMEVSLNGLDPDAHGSIARFIVAKFTPNMAGIVISDFGYISSLTISAGIQGTPGQIQNDPDAFSDTFTFTTPAL